MNLVCGDGAPGKGDLKRSFNTQGVQGDDDTSLYTELGSSERTARGLSPPAL